MGAAHKLIDKDILRSLVPLNALSENHFNELIKKAKIEEMSSGHYLFKKGDRDHLSYYVLSGEVALMQGRKVQSVVIAATEGALHPIAPQQPRQFTARIKGRSTIMCIDSGLLDVMLTWDQTSGSNYEVSDIQSDEDEDWMTRMLQSELLVKLPALNIQQLIVRMEEVEAKSGDVIVQQDEEGDYYYIIKEGVCVVARQLSERGKPVKLAELGAGDSFGEEALLSGGKRNASIIMKGDGTLMRLSKTDFDELLKDPLIKQVDYKKGCKIVKDNGAWLDVRLPGEYDNGHLPGSINIPLAAIRDESSRLDSNTKYVVCCDTGRRSSSAIFLLGECGFEGYVLEHGLAGVPNDVLEVSSDLKGSADVIPFNKNSSGQSLEIRDKEHAASRKAIEENQQKIQFQQEKLDALEHELQSKNDVIGSLKFDLDESAQYQKDAQRLQTELRETIGKKSELEKQLASSASSGAGNEEKLENLSAQLKNETDARQTALEKLSETEKQLQHFQQESDELQQGIKEIQDEMVTLQMSLQEEGSIRQDLEQKYEAMQKDYSNLESIRNYDTSNLDEAASELRSQLEQQQATMQQAEQNLESIEQKYKSAQESLNLAEKEIAILKSDRDEHASVLEIVDIEREKGAMLEAQLSSLELEFKQKREGLESAEAEIATLRSNLGDASEIQASLDEERETKGQIAQQLEALELESKQKTEEIASAEAEIDTLKLQIVEDSELQAILDDEREAKVQIEQQLASLELESQKKREDFESAETEIAALKSKLGEAEEIQTNLDAEHEVQQKTEQQLESLEKEFAEAQKALEGAEAELEEKLGEFKDMQDHLDAELEEKQTLEQKIESLDQDVVKTQQDLESANEEIDRQKTELAGILELQQTLDVESETRKTAEHQIEGLEEELKQGKDALVEVTNKMDKVRSESEKSRKGASAIIDELREEGQALQNQVEKIVNDSEQGRQQYQQIEDELVELKNEKEALTQQLEEVILSGDDLKQQLSSLQGEMQQSSEKQEAVVKQVEDDVSRLEQELNNMKDKEEEYKKSEKELADELDKLTVDLEQVNAYASELDGQLEQALDTSNTKKDENIEIDSELSESREVIEEAKALREEMKQLKNSIMMEKEDAKGTVEKSAAETENEASFEDSELQEENEILRKELENIYRDQEIAIETGRAPTKPKPLDLPNLLGNKPEENDSEESQLIEDAKSVLENEKQDDPFEVADVDKKLFQASEEVANQSKRGAIFFVIAAVIILGVVSAYWYFQKPEEENDTVKVINEKAISKQQEVLQLADKKDTLKPTDKKNTSNIKNTSPKEAEQKVRRKITRITASDTAEQPVQVKKVPASKREIKPVLSKSVAERALMSKGKIYKDILKLDGRGPVMVRVPKGSFEMGSASSSTYFDERPRHTVTLKSFAISRYEVTFDDYDRYADAESLPKPDDNGWGRGQRPVINVSWNDAAAYAKWLSEQTGHYYRLPSEAEWEYAARAGSRTMYWWGSVVDEYIANCFNCGSQWDGEGTAPVGSFENNALGLHDISGNVMEWTQDCYHKNYKGAPTDGKAWDNTNCVSRMVRGGSYRTTTVNLRTSKREHLPPGIYADNVGFRLVRE